MCLNQNLVFSDLKKIEESGVTFKEFVCVLPFLFLKTMESVYVVVENGNPYPVVYKTYTQAVNAVKTKHKETLDEDSQFAEEYGLHTVNVIDVPENASGEMSLYIEKGIHIIIYKLPVC